MMNDNSNSPLITLRDISMILGGRDILSGVNLTIANGEFLAITGPNGGGKTTFLRILLELMQPSSGTLSYHTPNGRRPTTGYLPQKNSIDSRFPITVEEVVASGMLGRPTEKTQRTDRERAVTRILERIGITDIRRNPIGEISGGQLQRAMIGRALVADPKLIVMDEPLSYLDKSSESTIYDILSDLHGDKRTIIVVSHELTGLKQMADRIIEIDRTIRSDSRLR